MLGVTMAAVWASQSSQPCETRILREISPPKGFPSTITQRFGLSRGKSRLLSQAHENTICMYEERTAVGKSSTTIYIKRCPGTVTALPLPSLIGSSRKSSAHLTPLVYRSTRVKRTVPSKSATAMRHPLVLNSTATAPAAWFGSSTAAPV